LPIDSQEPASDPARQNSTSRTEHPKRPFVRIVVWVAILLLFVFAFYWVLNRHGGAGSQKSSGGKRAFQGTAPVVPATAKQGNIGVYQDAIGTVTPIYTSLISSQVNGIVTAVNYREGQTVAKGQKLIEIDPRPYQANLLQAQGTLEHDHGVLAQAQMDLERYRTAWASNAIPRQQFEDQEKLVQQDAGTVKQDQGTVQYDQVQVDFCEIKAPISGRIGLRLVDPGNVATSAGGATLAVITQIEPITVIFTIPEDALSQVSPHLRGKTKLTVDAYDRGGQKKLATGALLTLDNQIDTTTGTVKARAQFDNRNSALYPNEFVNVRLLVDTLKNVTLIPSSAIQHNGNAAFVYVIANNKAEMRTVKVGVTDGDTTQVTGVNPGEIVANSSFDKLQPNAAVQLSKQAAAPASTSEGSAP
jgi:membrane fusion protein, multidrug efflux system